MIALVITAKMIIAVAAVTASVLVAMLAYDYIDEEQ